MKLRQYFTSIEITTRFACSAIALVLISTVPQCAPAQDGHANHQPQQQQELTVEQKNKANALVKVVRDATERFKNVEVAKAEGYALQFGCVTGDDTGAMGLHYVNGALVSAGAVDATRPQIVIYEPMADGSLKLIGADYLVLADEWNKKNSGPPQLMGQLFHLFEYPNRFGLPAFYTLHVWAWKDNPKGAFVNWHPNVSCDHFGGQEK